MREIDLREELGAQAPLTAPDHRKEGERLLRMADHTAAEALEHNARDEYPRVSMLADLARAHFAAASSLTRG